MERYREGERTEIERGKERGESWLMERSRGRERAET